MKYSILLLTGLALLADGEYIIEPTNLPSHKRMIYSPRCYKDGLIYTMSSDPISDNFSGLYFSKIIDGRLLGPPQPIKIKPRNFFPKGIGVFDYCPITGEVFFTAFNPYAEEKLTQSSLALFFGKLDDTTIKDVRMLYFCKPESSFAHSTISSDGKTMIFAAERNGYLVLHQSFRESANSGWSEPEIIEELKSEQLNIFPRLLNDSLLVFSSGRAGGMGDTDFYTSKKVNGRWTEPVNWQALNTPYSESALDMIDEKRGYFSASRNGGADFLYYFEIKE